MELTAWYGLEFDPFIKNARNEILFTGTEYKEALVRLGYLVQTKGFGVLTGAPGRGKTTVVRNWSASLPSSLYKVVYTSLSAVTVNDFYRNLALSLGAQPAYRKTENFKSIQNEILRLSIDKKKTPVIILDEANYISTAVLNDLKILFNFELDSRDRAVVLLVGLPKLNDTLQLGIHEPLRQRIIMNYSMDGLSKEEGREYIRKKLEGAGCSQQVFEDNAVEAVLNSAEGTPRMISKLCHAAMVVGNSLGQNLVTADVVMKAVNDSILG